MKQDDIDNELYSDKALTEALVGKEALKMLDAKIQEVPDHYFNEFPNTVLKAIHSEDSKTKIIQFGVFSKIAITATLLLIAATGYIYYEKILPKASEIASVNIQELTSEVIENYIESNEFFVEVDWQSEIDKSSAELEEQHIPLNKDTNQLNN